MWTRLLFLNRPLGTRICRALHVLWHTVNCSRQCACKHLYTTSVRISAHIIMTMLSVSKYASSLAVHPLTAGYNRSLRKTVGTMCCACVVAKLQCQRVKLSYKAALWDCTYSLSVMFCLVTPQISPVSLGSGTAQTNKAALQSKCCSRVVAWYSPFKNEILSVKK